MRTNKAPIRGMVIRRPANIDQVKAETLVKDWKKKGYVPPENLEFSALDKKLQDAFSLYVGAWATQSSPNTKVVLTYKEMKGELKQIHTAAEKLLKERTRQWSKKLDNHLRPNSSISLATRAYIASLLYYAGYSIDDLKTHLKILLNQNRKIPLTIKPPSCPLDNILHVLIEDDQAYRNRLEGLHGEDAETVYVCVRQERSGAHNPFLMRLIEKTAPIWKQLTGRSLKFVSVDITCSEKKSYYASWINSQLKVLKFQEIKDQTIVAAAKKIEKFPE